jgi:diaminopimelate epimerase
MRLAFTKMQALGNDFIIIDNRDGRLRTVGRYARRLCDRRFGIGADQLLLLSNSRKADFKMRIFNSDGSEVEMCGNGIRCLARYIWDNIISPQQHRRQNHLSIETLAGTKYVEQRNGLIMVEMGEPVLKPAEIPLKTSELKAKNLKLILKYPLRIKDRTFRITCVSMGNPHAVIVVDNVKAFPVGEYGPLIEHHHLFPKRTNVEFIEIVSRKRIMMRVWERGAGETMACGTGASAATVASSLLGLTERKVTVDLAGGRLYIDWSDRDNRVYMTGPAEKVFEGQIEL